MIPQNIAGIGYLTVGGTDVVHVCGSDGTISLTVSGLEEDT
jgi:hypothetical protein